MHKRLFIHAGSPRGVFGWALVCEVEVGGWLLLGFFTIESQLGGVLGLAKVWQRWLRLIKMECSFSSD